MEKEEIWTVIKVTKRTIWEISDQGNVKKNGKLVIFDDSIEGYYKICLGWVHRLVAITYVPNPENKPCVDHINGDKHDNRACNLRWVTYSENTNNPNTKEHFLGKNPLDYMTEEAKSERSLKISNFHKNNTYNNGRVHIHLGNINKSVKQEELNDYLDKGWIKGESTHKCKGFVWIHLDNKTSFIPKDKLDEYLKNGWLKGRK